METYRAWINQCGTTINPHRELHGKRCIVQDVGDPFVRVWFTDGPIHSMEIHRLWISKLRLSSAG